MVLLGTRYGNGLALSLITTLAYRLDLVRRVVNSRRKFDTDLSLSALGPTPKIQAVYKPPFRLAYVVTLAEHQLSTDLHVENMSEGVIEFQALLHNYIRAPADEVSVTPLQHLAYFDKTDLAADGHPKQKVESRSAVDVRGATDSVYENALQDYKVEWPGGGIKIRSVNMKDVVVWNPQEGGRKMADMEEDGWYFQSSRRWCCPLTANTRL